jgi:hypothetical protein
MRPPFFIGNSLASALTGGWHRGLVPRRSQIRLAQCLKRSPSIRGHRIGFRSRGLHSLIEIGAFSSATFLGFSSQNCPTRVRRRFADLLRVVK